MEEYFGNYEELFAFWNIFRILSNIDKFVSWLENEDKIVEDSFMGYQFFLRTVYRSILRNLFKYNYPFLIITEDKITERAAYISEHIKDVPDTSEKMICIRNLFQLSKDIEKAKDFENLRKALRKVEPLLQFIDYIFNNHIETSRKWNKTELLKITSIFFTFIYFNDTRNSKPWANDCLYNFEIKTLSEKYLVLVRKGYIYSLKFLWTNYLGEEGYNKSTLRDFEEVLEIEPNTEQLDESNIYLLEGRPFWQAVDNYYGKIKSEIIEPMCCKYKFNGFKIDFFIINNVINFEQIRGFLDQFIKSPDEITPYYFDGKDFNEQLDELDIRLYWYPVHMMKPREIYHGVSVFNSLLLGETHTKILNNSNEKIFIKIFKHPENDLNSGKNRISLGILTPTFGLFDYSQWLIFYCCATDFSGTGTSEFIRAMDMINRCKRLSNIDLEEIIIEVDFLYHYVNEKNDRFGYFSVYDFSQRKKNLITRIQRELPTLAEKYRFLQSRLFEYIVFSYLIQKYPNSEIGCNKIIKNEQIDILSTNENEVIIFECKMDLHENLNNIIKQLKRKERKIKREFSRKLIRSKLCVFEEISSDRKERIEKNNIVVIDNFHSIIMQDNFFLGTRSELNKLLKSTFFEEEIIQSKEFKVNKRFLKKLLKDKK